jgi:hypothetical protein
LGAQHNNKLSKWHFETLDVMGHLHPSSSASCLVRSFMVNPSMYKSVTRPNYSAFRSEHYELKWAITSSMFKDEDAAAVLTSGQMIALVCANMVRCKTLLRRRPLRSLKGVVSGMAGMSEVNTARTLYGWRTFV